MLPYFPVHWIKTSIVLKMPEFWPLICKKNKNKTPNKHWNWNCRRFPYSSLRSKEGGTLGNSSRAVRKIKDRGHLDLDRAAPDPPPSLVSHKSPLLKAGVSSSWSDVRNLISKYSSCLVNVRSRSRGRQNILRPTCPCFCCTLRQRFASNGSVKAFQKHPPPATFQGLSS